LKRWVPLTETPACASDRFHAEASQTPPRSRSARQIRYRLGDWRNSFFTEGRRILRDQVCTEGRLEGREGARQGSDFAAPERNCEEGRGSPLVNKKTDRLGYRFRKTWTYTTPGGATNGYRSGRSGSYVIPTDPITLVSANASALAAPSSAAISFARIRIPTPPASFSTLEANSSSRWQRDRLDAERFPSPLGFI
jgi:hypothetical protein